MAIEEKYFRMMNEKYGSGIGIEEYNGKFSLVSARKGSDGNYYSDWAFPQDKDRKPREKAIPVKVPLGDSRDEAIATLRHFCDLVNGVDEGDIPF